MYIYPLKQLFILPVIILATLALVSCDREAPTVEMPHIHGLGFSPDGRQLIVPAHDGLRIFADGRWSIPDVPAHDYMGYAAADDGFYSSGHPHPSSDLVNPFGLVKSTDGGKTLVKLGFEGESDFHLMAVSYETHAIYVLNPAPNSQLSAGLHYSLDDGQTWQPATTLGVTARSFRLAVHPTGANVVALATEGGLFLSSDHGDSFTRIGDASPVTAVTFHADGKMILFAAGRLLAYDLAIEQTTEVPSPTIAADDAIGYIAVNPVQNSEISLATFNRDIYLSSDGGQSWSQLAKDGQAK